jgi:serine/threonine-protein kinase
MPTPTGSHDATLRIASGSSPALDGGVQFAPGSIVAGRYRIVSLLGSGGMGEVYRADDIKLEQPVALKFLPPALARDPVLLARLHDEVRLGRQVAHPNVCRIYDIGEAGDAHFVAMEYVDGEDLARLLHRIGRLAPDKAIELAHGIAAGLAAAHAKGILHRDLKPANVMIDSHGAARITDFGLALTTDNASLDRAGTPAYMAPEQLEGKPASVQSDIYALGLVMYEMVTGRKPHGGHSIAELHEARTLESQPPSTHVRDIDPSVERVILRCLARDPADRPRTARELLEALPGGDPIAAALAAGQTPSPRAVAAAGTEGSLSPRAAWSLLAVIAIALAAVIVMARAAHLTRRIPFDKPPELLEARAAEMATALGVDAPRFRAARFFTNELYLGWIIAHDRSLHRWDRLRTGYPPLTLLVRFAPRPLVWLGNGPWPGPSDPPLGAGMTTIDVDPSGRLVSLAAIPTATRPGRADWRPLLSLTGLDPARLTPAAPRDVLPFDATERAAWNGALGNVPVRVEAAAVNATPVWLHLAGPWETDVKARTAAIFNPSTMAAVTWPLITAAVLFAAFLVWNNYRRGRIDRSGAMRVAVFVFLLEVAAFLLGTVHSFDFRSAVALMRKMLGEAFVWSGSFVFLYIALEPWVRRRWPELLIAWSRLLSGKWHDPMVGRDVLLGLTGGVGHGMLALASGLAPTLFGTRPELWPRAGFVDSLDGIRFGLAHIPGAISTGIAIGVTTLVILVGFAALLRRRGFAVAAFFLLHGTATAIVTHFDLAALPFLLAIAAINTFLISRVGLLAVVASELGFAASFSMPQPVDPTSWTFAPSLVGTLSIVVVALWSFRTALGGQPAFSGFDD